MTEPTGVFTLPDNKFTRKQAAALRRLIANGAVGIVFTWAVR